jgi:hypothetical protein
MESAVVECDIDIEDVTINEDILIRNTVADDFVYRSTYRFGEVAVIKWRRV